MQKPLGLRARVGLSVVIIAALGIALAVRALLGHHPGHSNAPRAASSSRTAVQTSESPLPSNPAIGTTTATGTAEATAVETPPPDVSWALFDGIALPTSSTAGPTHVLGAVHAGFAHSPEGALIADTQIAVRYLATPGTGWRDVLSEQVVPGPGVNAYSKAREASGLADVQRVDTAGVGQIVGFRFITYTSSVAVIQIVVRFPSSGQYQVATNTVDWLNGDWKLQLLPDGSSASTVQTINDLAGFVAWSGVSS
jgi:hypothetical protein